MFPLTEFLLLAQFGAKISADICPPTLSVPRCKICEFQGTDNVQGQIPYYILYIFSRKIKAVVWIILQLFCNARAKNVYEQLTELN